MKFDNGINLKKEDRNILSLRHLYEQYGFVHYKMNKFEEYDLYVSNKDFLSGDNIITFTDTNGRLLALKPDVTLSIVKNYREAAGTVQKVYYNENEIYYGIVRNGEIITATNNVINCKHVAFEKTNVNKDQKKILLEIYQQEEKTDMLRKELAEIRQKIDDSSEEKEELCKKARVLAGTLMFNEFIEKFEEYLNPEVKRLMDLYGYHTRRNSTIPLAYNEIIIARTVILEEMNYCDIVEEHGNTFSMNQDEEALNVQAEYKEKYSKPLPTKWPLKQKLHFGINRTLCLTEGYILKVEGLSEEGAKKIAEEFNVCSKPAKKTNEY